MATLGVVVNADDPSILQACVSALKGGPVDAAPPAPKPTSPPAETKRSPVSPDVQQLAEDAIDASLKQVVKELIASKREPKFDGSEWGDRLIDLWRTLKQLEADGFQISAEEIEPGRPPNSDGK